MLRVFFLYNVKTRVFSLQIFENEFDMFQRIFKRFLTDETSIEWEKIKPPGQAEVSVLHPAQLADVTKQTQDSSEHAYALP